MAIMRQWFTFKLLGNTFYYTLLNAPLTEWVLAFWNLCHKLQLVRSRTRWVDWFWHPHGHGSSPSGGRNLWCLNQWNYGLPIWNSKPQIGVELSWMWWLLLSWAWKLQTCLFMRSRQNWHMFTATCLKTQSSWDTPTTGGWLDAWQHPRCSIPLQGMVWCSPTNCYCYRDTVEVWRFQIMLHPTKWRPSLVRESACHVWAQYSGPYI